MATVRQVQVTFDCADPERVARSWAAALGDEVPASAQGQGRWSACTDPTGAGPRLSFQRVPEGKGVDRGHLDVRVGTGLVGDERRAALEAEAVRLEDLGATRGSLLLADGVDESCQPVQDVEGDESCLD